MVSNKIALITGASSGIGKSTAQAFAHAGIHCIITGRRKERLDLLAEQLEEETGRRIHVLNFDVRSADEVAGALASLPEDWKQIDILVNNAGLALGLGTIDQGLLSDWDTMIDTNLKGLLYMSREVSRVMIAQQKEGHIINIGSVAGKEVYPNGNVYCSTKHAVDALGRAMRIDLLPHRIKVTNINPGMLESEFSLVRFHGDEARAKAAYQGMKPLHPEDVAEAILWAIQRPAHVNINEITLTPLAQGSARDVIRKNP